jgi:hypothetical protein
MFWSLIFDKMKGTTTTEGKFLLPVAWFGKFFWRFFFRGAESIDWLEGKSFGEITTDAAERRESGGRGIGEYVG